LLEATCGNSVAGLPFGAVINRRQSDRPTPNPPILTAEEAGALLWRTTFRSTHYQCR